MNLRFRFTKKHFLYVFYGAIAVLFIIKLIFPEITKNTREGGTSADTPAAKLDSIDIYRMWADSILSQPRARVQFEFNKDGSLKKHKIYSVSDFSEAFPDSNHVQLATAERLGVKPVKDRAQAEKRKDELVYVGSNPYYYVQKLYNSIPYLIPPAAVLLEHIGRTFQDSLAIKGIPWKTMWCACRGITEMQRRKAVTVTERPLTYRTTSTLWFRTRILHRCVRCATTR